MNPRSAAFGTWREPHGASSGSSNQSSSPLKPGVRDARAVSGPSQPAPAARPRPAPRHSYSSAVKSGAHLSQPNSLRRAGEQPTPVPRRSIAAAFGTSSTPPRPAPGSSVPNPSRRPADEEDSPPWDVDDVEDSPPRPFALSVPASRHEGAPSQRGRTSSMVETSDAAAATRLALKRWSAHGQAASESWDADFLFQQEEGDDGSPLSRASGSSSSERSVKARRSTGKPASARGKTQARPSNSGVPTQWQPEDEEEDVWDSFFEPQLAQSASAATLLAGPAKGARRSTTRLSPTSSRGTFSRDTELGTVVGAAMGRTTSRSSRQSNETDLSARLNLQSEVSSWRSRVSSLGSGSPRSSTPSLEGVRSGRLSGASSLQEDGTEDEPELRTSDAGTEDDSADELRNSGDETETESAGRVRLGKSAALQQRGKAPSSKRKGLNSVSSRERMLKSASVARQTARSPAASHAAQAPVSPSTTDSTSGADSQAESSTSSFAAHERNTSRNSLRAFLKNATSPKRRERETSGSSTVVNASSARTSFSRWRLGVATEAASHKESGRGGSAERSSSPLSASDEYHGPSNARSLSHLLARQSAAAVSSTPTLSSAEQLDRPSTPTTDVSYNRALAAAALEGTPSGRRSARAGMIETPPRSSSRRDSRARAAAEPVMHQVSPIQFSVSPAQPIDMRRAPSHLDSLQARRNVSNSTTATTASGTGGSEGWTGTSQGGMETEGTSLFGSSCDDLTTPPVSAREARRGSSSDTSESSFKLSSRSFGASRKGPRPALHQLPEGKISDVPRSAGLLQPSAQSGPGTVVHTPAAPDSPRRLMSSSPASTLETNRATKSAATPQSRPRSRGQLPRTKTIQGLQTPETSADVAVAARPPTASIGKGIARRNSLGDLRIPARISKAQDGLRANMDQVREFARGVEELKTMRARYRALMSELRDEASSRFPSDRASPLQLLGTPAAVTAQVSALESSLSVWWEMADVLVGLGEGRGATDSEANLATLTHSPDPRRERCITLDAPSTIGRRGSDLLEPHSFASAFSQQTTAGAQQLSASQSKISQGSHLSSHALGSSRSVAPGREIDILSAMLAGAPPEQISPQRKGPDLSLYTMGGSAQHKSPLPGPNVSVTSLTFAEPERPAFDEEEIARRRTKRSSHSWRTAPAGTSPFVGASTDSLSLGETSREGEGRRAVKKAARGLQSLLELVRSFKINDDPPDDAASSSYVSNASQVSLSRRLSRTSAGPRKPAAEPPRAPSSPTAATPDRRRRSWMSKKRAEPSAPSGELGASPRRKRSASRLFSRELEKNEPVPALPSPGSSRVFSGASAKTAVSAGDSSIDSEWNSGSDFDTSLSGLRQSVDNKPVHAGAPAPDSRRQRVLSFLGGRPRGQSIASAHSGSSPSASVLRLDSGASPQPGGYARRADEAAVSPAHAAHAAGLPPAVSRAASLAPSASNARTSQPKDSRQRPGSYNRSFSVGVTSSSDTSTSTGRGRPAFERPSHSSIESSEAGWALSSPSLSPQPPSRSALAASTAVNDAEAATYRKLALSPQAIPSLLIYVKATCQHCAQGVVELEALSKRATATPASYLSAGLPPTSSGWAPGKPIGAAFTSASAGSGSSSARNDDDRQATVRAPRDGARALAGPSSRQTLRAWSGGKAPPPPS